MSPISNPPGAQASAKIVSGNYAVQSSDHELLGDVSAGSPQITLPPAVGSGRTLKVAAYLPAGAAETANLVSILTAANPSNAGAVDALGDYNQQAPALGVLSQTPNSGRLAPATYYVVVVAVVEIDGVLRESLVSTERSVVVAATMLAVPPITSVVNNALGGTLPASTNFRYWATAVDATGNETPIALGIANPGVTVTTGAGPNNQNVITYTPSPGATTHNLYRQETSGTGIGNPMQKFAMGTSGTYTDGTPWAAGNNGTPPDVGTAGASITASWPTGPALFYRWLRATATGAVSDEYDVPNKPAGGRVTFVDQGLPSKRRRNRPTVDGTVLQLGRIPSGATYRAVDLSDAALGAWEAA